MAEEVKNELGECQKQRDEYLAGWQRARADLLNYKKEEIERIGELIKYVGEEIILKILPILDNFELAEKNSSGFSQIKIQLKDLLKSYGVEEIKSEGKFDPQIHEVVGESEKFEEVQKGYTINGRLLRPAKVKVAK